MRTLDSVRHFCSTSIFVARREVFSCLQRFPELFLALSYFCIVFSISLCLDVDFTLPSLNGSIFIGFSYVAALVLGMSAAIFASFFVPCSRRERLRFAVLQLSYVGIFILVMWLHFHLKMWIPLINSLQFDSWNYTFESFCRPLVTASMWLHEAVARHVVLSDAAYTEAFIVLFLVSFFVHAISDQRQLRRLILASMLIQILGSFCYLILPSVGPFIYEVGVSKLATHNQHAMLIGYQQLLSPNGLAWLNVNDARYFVSGLAAMPSLHAGATWIFVAFAYRYKAILLFMYVPIFAWILVEAIATRWHYLIDLPAGILLATICIYAAEKLAVLNEQRTEPIASLKISVTVPVHSVEATAKIAAE